MAGPDGRARCSSSSPGLELVPCYWEPDGNFTDHEPNPLLPENRQFVIEKVRAEGANLGWRGTATPAPLLLHRRRQPAPWTGTSSRPSWPSRCSQRTRARTSSLSVPGPPARSPTRCARPAAQPLVDPGAGHAFFKRPRILREEGGVVRRRGLRPLLSGRVLQRGLGHAAGAARARAARPAPAGRSPSCWSRTARAIPSPARSTSVVADPAAKLEELRVRYADAEITTYPTASRSTTTRGA